jgi:predicted RNA binding protein YcfA (HicA-like mRNA interferase family)
MNLSPDYLIRLLEGAGYSFKRSKGSHQVFYNPINNKTIIVPYHNGKDLKKGTFMAIVKQAGIEL